MLLVCGRVVKYKSNVHKSCTNTSCQISVHYVKIFMHTQNVKLKHNGIWEWGIYGLNGWGTYGKVSDCVLGDMLKQHRSPLH